MPYEFYGLTPDQIAADSGTLPDISHPTIEQRFYLFSLFMQETTNKPKTSYGKSNSKATQLPVSNKNYTSC